MALINNEIVNQMKEIIEELFGELKQQFVFSIDIESLQNRLLNICYVPATSASLNRLLFFLFCCGH